MGDRREQVESAAIGGKWMCLWRAVDADGEVLDCLVQSRRDKRAAKKLMRKLLKKQGFAPSHLVTDDLKSYPAAFQEMRLAAIHHRGKRKNNRAESSHVPRAGPRIADRWLGWIET